MMIIEYILYGNGIQCRGFFLIQLYLAPFSMFNAAGGLADVRIDVMLIYGR